MPIGGKFDIVLVWKIDRFGRSLKHLVNALGDLDAYGVAFASLKDNLDLSTPSGRLMFQIIGAMAEFERALIQERVKAGLHNARRNGKQLGRPRRVVDLDRHRPHEARGSQPPQHRRKARGRLRHGPYAAGLKRRIFTYSLLVRIPARQQGRTPQGSQRTVNWVHRKYRALPNFYCRW